MAVKVDTWALQNFMEATLNKKSLGAFAMKISTFQSLQPPPGKWIVSPKHCVTSQKNSCRGDKEMDNGHLKKVAV